MKIAITGGAGFIGSRLAARLRAAGDEVLILDRRSSATLPKSSRICDVTDREALVSALEGVDAVFHLAAEHRDDVRPISRYYDVNVGGARNLIAACEANGIRTVIFTSTVAVYPLDAGEVSEEQPPAPFNDYGRSKLESEQVLEDWAKGDESRSLTTIRLVATFGPGNRGNIFNLIQQIRSGRFVMVGSGRNHKSVAFVENVAAFLQHCLGFGPGVHLYNYADKPDLSMSEFVAHVRSIFGASGLGLRLPYPLGLVGGMAFDVAARASGRTFPISASRVKKFCADTVVNSDRVRAAGFTAPYSLPESLEHTIAEEFGAPPAMAQAGVS